MFFCLLYLLLLILFLPHQPSSEHPLPLSQLALQRPQLQVHPDRLLPPLPHILQVLPMQQLTLEQQSWNRNRNLTATMQYPALDLLILKEKSLHIRRSQAIHCKEDLQEAAEFQQRSLWPLPLWGGGTVTTRSGRQVKRPSKYNDYQ